MTKILGIQVYDRIKEAGKTQAVLTKYAHCIKTRLGFHELTENTCSRNGIIVLQLTGNLQDYQNFEGELNKIEGIKVQSMHFDN